MRLPLWFTRLLSLHSATLETTPKQTDSSQASLNTTLYNIPEISTFTTYVYQTNLQLFSEENTAHKKVAIFAPTNEAIAALNTKPHEGPRTNVQYELTEGAYRARWSKFATQWILAHVPADYPLSFTTGSHQSLFNKSRLNFQLHEGEGPEWRRLSVNGVNITEQHTTSGGEIYIVRSTLFDWDQLREE